MIKCQNSGHLANVYWLRKLFTISKFGDLFCPLLFPQCRVEANGITDEVRQPSAKCSHKNRTRILWLKSASENCLCRASIARIWRSLLVSSFRARGRKSTVKMMLLLSNSWSSTLPTPTCTTTKFSVVATAYRAEYSFLSLNPYLRRNLLQENPSISNVQRKLRDLERPFYIGLKTVICAIENKWSCPFFSELYLWLTN